MTGTRSTSTRSDEIARFVAPRQDQEILGQVDQPVGLLGRSPDRCDEFVPASTRMPGQLQFDLEDGQRSSQLVAGRRHEAALDPDCRMEALQEVVQGLGKGGDLVMGSRDLQSGALVEPRDLGCLSAHSLHRGKRRSCQEPGRETGQEHGDASTHDNDSLHLADRTVHGVQRCTDDDDVGLPVAGRLGQDEQRPLRPGECPLHRYRPVLRLRQLGGIEHARSRASARSMRVSSHAR